MDFENLLKNHEKQKKHLMDIKKIPKKIQHKDIIYNFASAIKGKASVL